MSILNRLKSMLRTEVASNVSKAVEQATYQKKTFTFTELPSTLEEFTARPEANMKDAFGVAALTVVALNAYSQNKDLGAEMLNALKGPSPLTPHDKSFLNDRFMDGKDYVPRSYFAGAKPENDYTPTTPYTITVKEGAHSKDSAGYMKLFLTSGGADSDRVVVLRTKPSTGEWFLWQYEGLTPSIRTPKSQNAWA